MSTSSDDAITFISSSGKEFRINSDTELNIENEKPIESSDFKKLRGNEKPIDTNDFKDALLASLYSQVELLRNQLEEKDSLRSSRFERKD